MLSTQKSKATHGWFYDPFFIAISLIFFYALWIGSYPLFTPDEGRYSEVAREMIVTGDYITPRLNGIAFLDKPILYYWLQASAIQLFGLKEWSLRFWPACMGIMGSIVVYITGRILFNRRTGIISAVILATSPLYFGASHYANLDLEVAVLVSSALLFFITAMNTPSQRSRSIFLILAYVFSALAVLTKGLIGIAFPVMIIGSWIVLLNRWNLLLQIRLIIGLVLFIIIAAPWYVLAQQANPQFFNYFFVLQQFSRFLTKADFNNQTTTWFYVPIVLTGFLPWTCFIFQAVFQHVKSIWQDKQKYSSELFIITWFVIVFTFFSIPKSKTIGYILPVFPALSLILGNYLSNYWGQFKNLGIQVGIFLFIALSLTLATLFLAEPMNNFFHLDLRLTPYIMTGGIILSLAALTTYILFRLNKFTQLFCCIALATALFLLCIISSAPIINHKSTKSLADIIATNIKPNDEVITYYRYYQDLPIYLQRRITVVADWHNDDIAKFDNWQRELWYHMNYVDSSKWLIEKPELIARWTGDKRLFLLITSDVYPLFMEQVRASHMTAKSYLLGNHSFNNQDMIMLVSNKQF